MPNPELADPSCLIGYVVKDLFHADPEGSIYPRRMGIDLRVDPIKRLPVHPLWAIQHPLIIVQPGFQSLQFV